MAQFGSDYSPTPAEGFRNAAAMALGVLFVAGLMFATSTSPLQHKAGFLSGGAVALALALGWLLSLPKVVGWLEWGRRVQAGEWRTTRAFRAASLFWVLGVSGYGVQVAAGAVGARAHGELLKMAVAVALLVIMVAFLVAVVVRTQRKAVELTLGVEGIYTAEWRGTVPWSAIHHVISPKTSGVENELRLVIRPEALSELPDAVRRWKGYPRVFLGKVDLSPEAAVAAMRVAYPALQVGDRSAGVVLPVRGATDIVEADV